MSTLFPSAKSTIYRSLLKIPFLETRIFESIRLANLGLPIWYFLGLDQFVWPFIGLLLGSQAIVLRVRANKGIVLTKFTKVSLFFILAQLLSGLFIIESEFYIVFLRNVLAWTGGTFLLIGLTNMNLSRKKLQSILWSWVLVLFISSVIGLFAFLSRQGFELKTLILYIVPQGMRDGITAATIWTRSFLSDPAIIAGQSFRRARSFFLYANSFAGFLVIGIPILAYLTHIYRRLSLRWWLVYITLGLCLISLYITTSRAGILSLLIGTLFFLIQRTRRADRIVWAILVILLITAALSLIIVSPRELIESGRGFIEDFFTLKGRSHITRLNILKFSILSWMERPFFGWGTPRSMALFGFSPAYPRLGSHSQFLSVLYRHGLFGLLIYSWMLITLLKRLRTFPSKDWRDGFRSYLVWAIVSNLIHSLMIQVDIDLIYFFFIWQLWAMADILPMISSQDNLVPSLNGSIK